MVDKFNVIDYLAILIKEDMEKERTPEELSLWWEEKDREFANSKTGHHFALLKRGLAGKFYDEIYPLKLFANFLYLGRFDIGCKSNLGNDNFDAIIRDYSKLPPSIIKIEFTLAIDGYDDYLRRKYLSEHGYVSALGSLKHNGTEKTGHKISVKFEPVSLEASLRNNLALIKNRAKQKGKPKNYGKDHVLVIMVDDSIAPRYDNQNDLDKLKEFIATDVINLPLDFAKLYILGLSGKTFLTYEIK